MGGPLHDSNRRTVPLHGLYALVVTLGVSIFAASATSLIAQAPLSTGPSQAPAKTTATSDPLGRETPRRAGMGFIYYINRGDYKTAARYLQPTPGQDTDLEECAKQFEALHEKFEGDIALLSDDPQGIVEHGLPPGQVRAGVLVVGTTRADVILVRVDDPEAGKIWLVSKETVASIPNLYEQMESEQPSAISRMVPAALTRRHLLRLSLAQWLGWLLSIPISFLLAWLFEFLVSVPNRVRFKLRRIPFKPVWATRHGMPLVCIVAILLHGLFVYLLRPPIFYRMYYSRFLATLLVVSIAWLVGGIIERGFEHALKRARAQGRGAESILILTQRFVHVVLLVVTLMVAMSVFGFDMKTALAGLGIGGLAIALGAQKSLENLIGGVSLLMDKAVHVGNFCRIGNELGTVEDIGLRSLKLRTLDQNLLVVPNGLLAQMQFTNMTVRSKLLINQNFSLRIETTVGQLQTVLDRVQSMLNQDAAIEAGTSRITVSSFSGAAYELNLFAYGKTGDYAKFTGIQQGVILKIAEIVEAAGTGFTGPTRSIYLSRDTGLDVGKAVKQARSGS